MKKHFTIKHGAWALGALLLGACNKGDYLDADAGNRPALSANISFVNARPVNAGLHFWTFTAQVTTEPVLPGKASPYLPATFGNVQINFTEGTGASYKASRQFGNQPTFSASGGPNGPIPGYYHSVFAARKKNDPAQDTLILFYDNLQPPAAGRARLRFVHLAPGVPAVSVTLQAQGKDSLLFAGVDYGSAGGSHTEGDNLNVWSLGPFVDVAAGTVNLLLRTVAGRQPVTVDGAGLSGLELQAGRHYTVFISGVPGKPATGAALLEHHAN